MLIKIITDSNLPRAFTLFDNAESVACECPVHFTDTAQLISWIKGKQLLADHVYQLTIPAMGFFFDGHSSDVGRPHTTLSESTVYVVACIAFKKNGKTHIIFFDGEAYICSDEGKTLERIIAGGLYGDAVDHSHKVADAEEGLAGSLEPEVAPQGAAADRTAVAEYRFMPVVRAENLQRRDGRGNL